MRYIFVKFQELPKQVRMSTYGYLGTLMAYNTAAAYIDAKTAIEEFKAGKLTKEPQVNGKTLTTKYDAAKFGAHRNFAENLYNSIIWLIKTIANIVPLIASWIN